jgi:hypothetical protein
MDKIKIIKYLNIILNVFFVIAGIFVLIFIILAIEPRLILLLASVISSHNSSFPSLLFLTIGCLGVISSVTYAFFARKGIVRIVFIFLFSSYLIAVSIFSYSVDKQTRVQKGTTEDSKVIKTNSWSY